MLRGAGNFKMWVSTFGCSISVRKDMEEKSEIMRNSWKENNYEPVMKGKQCMYCDFCRYKCQTNRAMTKHNLKHKNCQRCQVCGKVLKSDNILKSHTEVEYSKVTDSEALKVSHAKEYEEELPDDEQGAAIVRILEAYS